MVQVRHPIVLGVGASALSVALMATCLSGLRETALDVPGFQADGGALTLRQPATATSPGTASAGGVVVRTGSASLVLPASQPSLLRGPTFPGLAQVLAATDAGARGRLAVAAAAAAPTVVAAARPLGVAPGATALATPGPTARGAALPGGVRVPARGSRPLGTPVGSTTPGTQSSLGGLPTGPDDVADAGAHIGVQSPAGSTGAGATTATPPLVTVAPIEPTATAPIVLPTPLTPEVVAPDPEPSDEPVPDAPVAADPAPAEEEPAAPVVEEPAAPVVEEPAPPVVEEPAPPVVEEPAPPPVEEPAPPVEDPTPPVEEPTPTPAPAEDPAAAPAEDPGPAPADEPAPALAG